jgi:hypothetical protein
MKAIGGGKENYKFRMMKDEMPAAAPAAHR